jgi:hypothetical protein
MTEPLDPTPGVRATPVTDPLVEADPVVEVDGTIAGSPPVEVDVTVEDDAPVEVDTTGDIGTPARVRAPVGVDGPARLDGPGHLPGAGRFDDRIPGERGLPHGVRDPAPLRCLDVVPEGVDVVPEGQLLTGGPRLAGPTGRALAPQVTPGDTVNGGLGAPGAGWAVTLRVRVVHPQWAVRAVPVGLGVPAARGVGQAAVPSLTGVTALLRCPEVVTPVTIVATGAPLRLAVATVTGVPARLLIFGKAPSSVHDRHGM